MNNLIATIVIMLFCITALAQETNSENSVMLARRVTAQPVKSVAPLPAATVKNDVAGPPGAASQFNVPMSVQVLVGSQGVGADLKCGVLPNLSGRLGFGIIPLSASQAFKFSGFSVMGDLSTRFSNVHLLADYSPFKNQNFRIVGGAAYLIQGDATAIITPAGGYTVGDRTLTREQIGTLTADVKWNGVAPYLGIALFKGFPNRLFNVNLDLGTYYLSRPGTSFRGTQLLSENDANAIQFNQNMKGYRWLPVVQLNFNFRIK